MRHEAQHEGQGRSLTPWYTQGAFDRLANLGARVFFAHPSCPALKSKGKTMKNIFVGNLSFGTTEQDIRTLFEAHGKVDRVTIVTDRDSGQPRGFGFVEMTNNAEGDRAIAAVNGKEIGGRALNVNEAKPKSEGASRGGGGGRGNLTYTAPVWKQMDRGREHNGSKVLILQSAVSKILTTAAGSGAFATFLGFRATAFFARAATPLSLQL